MEVNFDGIVGPTHHYGGYAYGNIASMSHQQEISHPKAAALQGLQKMKTLADLGIPQAILPPRMRPSLKTLHALGFRGTDKEMFAQAAKDSPLLLQFLSSSASMWAANSATCSPSCDTADGKVHLTIANLQSQFHRAIEAEETYRLFSILFPNPFYFNIHPPLPSGGQFGDEGAANHTRFCAQYEQPGVHLFVYSKGAFEPKQEQFPFRQAREASQAVARQHGLNPKRVVFAQQNPEIIEKGVFHNDVIAVGNRNLFLLHEKAYVDTPAVLKKLKELIPLQAICVTEEMLPLETAVQSYLFNSQIVTLPSGKDLLVAPSECENLNLDWLPIQKLFVDVRESMRNGGGPACLRLRMVLTQQEKEHLNNNFFLTDSLYDLLVNWVEHYYRDQLSWQDLLDPSLLQEVMEALDSLTHILRLGNFYEFQQTTLF